MEVGFGLHIILVSEEKRFISTEDKRCSTVEEAFFNPVVLTATAFFPILSKASSSEF